MRNYQKLNNILGWIIFAIASMVYILTCEPTASFWDCGEYIATSYKLMVGHPPGAPFFQIMGRVFSLFAGDNHQMVPLLINYMSALASGMTIMFMFWSITMLTKKFIKTTAEYTLAQQVAIFGSGIVGSLAYTFSDSFWFSAVEGEVYATSSFFTAIVFWAILKWEANADQPRSNKWFVLIAYLVGLSIGVHLLNLLAIPAMTFVVYFKKFKPSIKGFIITSILSVLILGIVQSLVIPQIVNLFAKFELFFINGLGLPFNSGTIFFALLIIGAIGYGLYYTAKKGKPLYNTIILCFAFLLIGYSSFLMLVIRSNANTPLNENNPDNAINLLAFLNREQYGDWPIGSGQYYNAPLDAQNPYKDGNPVYMKDEKTGKYVVSDSRKATIPVYDDRFCTVFPRMWNAQHEKEYEKWGDIKGEPITVDGPNGKPMTINKPTFGENLTYFFRYQVNWMYFRYFMWNFAGKQNDIQGHGNTIHGNWISGISFLDNARLGDQSLMPDDLKNNKGHNKFYLLPLILGLIGMVYHYKKDIRNFWVIFLLFFFTGMAIVLYLNQYPLQPRERDYAYAASFYAFAFWIGFGVFALFDWITAKVKSKDLAISIAVGTVCLLCVPTIMAKEGWDDHDRSNRFTSVDISKNYLQSCDKDAILFTNGDNETFPLWYAQEVEGFRTDVRVCNLSLLNTDWYINQMRRQAYQSSPMPLTMTENQYRQGTHDAVYIVPDSTICKPKMFYNLKQLVQFALSDDKMNKVPSQRGDFNYFPTNNFLIPVNKANAIHYGIVSKADEKFIAPNIMWTMKDNVVQKNNLAVLDMLSCFNWKRPICFATTSGEDSYLGLEQWFEQDGLTYKLTPIFDSLSIGKKQYYSMPGRINTTVMYDNIMNKYKWGNMNNPKVYLDETNMRMVMNFRNNFARLADALIREGKNDKALNVLNKCMEVMPEKCIPLDFYAFPLVEGYYQLGKTETANVMAEKIAKLYTQYLNYYASLDSEKVKFSESDIRRDMQILNAVREMTGHFKNTKLSEDLNNKLKTFAEKFAL